MGLNLTPICVKRGVSLEELRGRSLAVDAHGELYQFLALIRLPDGTPLRDRGGRVTSHLSGLLFRTTRLISDYGIRLVFVFDGEPPALKADTLAQRRERKERAEEEYAEALAAGDLATAFTKATMTSRLTAEMVEDARRLLGLLGVLTVQAPSEGEAQAAFMAARGDVWAVGGKDYDSLLFGAPRLIRFVTLTGKEYLPSQGRFRRITPEVIDSGDLLAELGVSREQLVDIAILMGTDFNEGVKGIGPKTALKLIRQHGSIEGLPEEIRARVAAHYPAVREIFFNPEVTADYVQQARPPDPEGAVRFLVEERDFSRERVESAVRRLAGGAAEAATEGEKKLP